jgi:hypothetical protein
MNSGPIFSMPLTASESGAGPSQTSISTFWNSACGAAWGCASAAKAWQQEAKAAQESSERLALKIIPSTLVFEDYLKIL